MHFGCHCAFRRPGQQKCIQMLSAVDLRFSSFYPGNVWGSAGGPTQTGRRFLYGWITPQFLQRTNQVTVILLHPLISTKSKTVATNEKKSSRVFFPARGWLLMVELEAHVQGSSCKKRKGVKSLWRESCLHYWSLLTGTQLREFTKVQADVAFKRNVN